ncbi:MAG TPA: hypothetical protein VJ746_03765 [Nitrospira sp.]|nr:hypothetical protein [Nitrospira sp.]
MVLVSVDAYAGYKGEHTPRSFTVGDVREVIVEVVDRWYSDTHAYFRVRTAGGERYVLRYHLDEDRWELVMQERA